MAASIADQVSILERMLGGLEDLSGLDEHTTQAAFERARRLIADINQRGRQTRNQLSLERWNSLIGMLQNLAFVDPDSGGETDISSWCERQWAETLQAHPHNVNAMKGLGRCWLFKAQKPLARIYTNEHSPSSSSEGSGRHRLGISRPRPDPTETEDTERINSADYVDAKSLLRPALEAFDRAIQEANLQGTTTGRLLEISAEAYMSFGNVSHPRNNEIAYQKALRLLRQASEIQGFSMDPYLEDFLEDNIDFIQDS